MSCEKEAPLKIYNSIDVKFCLTSVTRRKKLFLYFLTELKTYHLSYSIYDSYNQFSIIYWVDNIKWLPYRVEKLTFRALALRRSDRRNCGLCVGLHAEDGATLLVGIWWRENKNKLVEWKALADTVRTKSADLKDKFLF